MNRTGRDSCIEDGSRGNSGGGGRRRFYLLPVLCCLFLLAALFPAGAQAESRPRYEMQVSLDFNAATLEVQQNTTLRNGTGVELRDLVFQVVPAHFGAFTLRSARVGGREVEASMNGTVLDLPLEAPLAPGGTAEVALSYQVRVPQASGRFGRGDGIMALGNWFPVLAVHQEGWDRHQYVDVGDAFFTEVADFHVSVASDVPVKIATSGQLISQEGMVQSFRAENERDFGMAISDRYQVRTREVDGVLLSAYGLSAARLEGYLDAAATTMRWFSAKLVPYPYPSLTIAEIHDRSSVPTAQEYPALIFVYTTLGQDGGGPGSYSEYNVAHEVAHQWFYSLVGNDQVHDPWLDEALTTYVHMLFYRDQQPRSFDHYWNRIVSGYRARAAGGGDRPVNTTINDYSGDLPYFDIVYRKGAIFLDELRRLMGDEPFFDLLRDYLHTYAGKTATPRAFLDMAYSRAGSELPHLVARYFTYGAFSDGMGYDLRVQWPERPAASGIAELEYAAGFPVARAKLWLDNRLLLQWSGGGPARFSLEGVEEGEYVMRLELLDPEGGLYQRAHRVKVAAAEATPEPLPPPEPEATPNPLPSPEPETTLPPQPSAEPRIQGSPLPTREPWAATTSPRDARQDSPLPWWESVVATVAAVLRDLLGSVAELVGSAA